ncbi:nucleotide-diphospho-sugar transferase [Zopfochytrium polystomum]|nr:nucleotide-diphospho-sugar transferase [Zopfochytrium polystomum]
MATETVTLSVSVANTAGWACGRDRHSPGGRPSWHDRLCSPASFARNKGTDLELLGGLCVPEKSREMGAEDRPWPVSVRSRNLGGNECTGDQEIYNKYDVEHIDFTRPEFHDGCSVHPAKDPSAFKVPKIIHFVFGLQPDFGGFPFRFFHYMAIKIAHVVQKPDKILLHYKYAPEGEWWEKTKKYATLVEVEEVPTEIFGNPIKDVAHMADVVRMNVLLKYGGIYLDTDVYAYRSFDSLLHHETVLGAEKGDGLCNGVIISAANSTFLRAWYESYRTFDASLWNEHSVLLPKRLASSMPNDICTLPRISMFYPTWDYSHVDFVHKEDEYIFDNSYQYAYHAWNHRAIGYLKELTPEVVRSKDTSFNRLLRPFLDGDGDENNGQQPVGGGGEGGGATAGQD